MTTTQPEATNSNIEVNILNSPEQDFKRIRIVLLIILIIVLIADVIALTPVKKYFFTTGSQTISQETTQQNTAQISKTNPRPKNLSCPVDQKVCRDQKNYNSTILTGQLAKGSEVLAAFDGQIQIQPSSYQADKKEAEEFNIILLENKELGLLATYTLKAESTTGITDVLKGEKIATIGSKNLNFYNGNSFIFELAQLGGSGYTTINLEPDIF